MRYTEQQQFINRGRLWGSAVVALVLTAAAVCLKYLWARDPRPLLAIEFGITALALAISIYYTPDYLHLTVNPDKKLRWEIKVRWSHGSGPGLQIPVDFQPKRRSGRAGRDHMACRG